MPVKQVQWLGVVPSDYFHFSQPYVMKEADSEMSFFM